MFCIHFTVTVKSNFSILVPFHRIKNDKKNVTKKCHFVPKREKACYQIFDLQMSIVSTVRQMEMFGRGLSSKCSIINGMIGPAGKREEEKTNIHSHSDRDGDRGQGENEIENARCIPASGLQKQD